MALTVEVARLDGHVAAVAGLAHPKDLRDDKGFTSSG